MDAKTWDERYRAENLVWGSDPNRWVVQELGTLMPSTALDLGSGEGRNAIWLASEGWRVTALDFSQVALDRARSLAEKAAQEYQRELDITWQCQDASSAELPRSAFDAVLVCYLHLPEYERTPAMRAAARALAPGGTLLVVGHDTTNLSEGYGGPQNESVLYTAADVEEDLQDYISSGSLIVERSGRVAREIETDDGSVIAWDCLLRLKGRDMSKGEVTFG
ncbi:class I SAM-dependent methyltransferase [Gephyromycinifex aptenodytis]|uniref:class I SAM-dependent methyltransferase n=1 Tax=Gephyromycinifex aptenodytis TaxID=2716227 RepID=UPI001448A09A|nr:class I SAM-dependent methyltransferase [Gephyromycinifex aptenodytis]